PDAHAPRGGLGVREGGLDHGHGERCCELPHVHGRGWPALQLLPGHAEDGARGARRRAQRHEQRRLLDQPWRAESRSARRPVEDPDQADLDVRKEIRRAGTLSLPLVFPDGKSPGMISRNLAQRSLGVRNTFTFRTSWKYITLEPTCIVTLTDPYLGLAQTPV